ncbi:hypothetical protein Avbf_10868 [Armadillidium vulgare]|nr:hypothetical protein Avbf_10868 [Armadillidium vulgare]
MYEDSTKGSFFGILRWTPNKFRYCAINFSFRRIYLVKPQNSFYITGNSIRLKIFKKQDISESNLN